MADLYFDQRRDSSPPTSGRNDIVRESSLAHLSYVIRTISENKLIVTPILRTRGQMTINSFRSWGQITPLITLTALFLAACSGATNTSSVASLAPTRTAAPQSENPAPRESATPKATAVPSKVTESNVPATAVPAPVVKMDICAAVKPDLTANPPKDKSAQRAAGQVVYLDSDGNVALTDAAGRRTSLLTTDAFLAESQGAARMYQFPTFSNDGKSLAFVSLELSDNGRNMTQTLHVAEARAKGKLTELYSSHEENIPYLDWSPDSASVTFLTIRQGQGEIRIVPSSGGENTVLDTGTSAYWHWRNDSAAIVANLGGDEKHMSVIDPNSRATVHNSRIKTPPGRFQSPHYSPDGKFMIFAIAQGSTQALILADADGTPLCRVVDIDSSAYFAWSPNGRQIAILDTVSPMQMPQPLVLIDLISNKRTEIDRQVISFFWSPDGDKIAVYSVVTNAPATKLGLGPARTYAPAQQTDTTALRIEIVDATSGDAVTVADTLPSRQFAQFFQFFDQYSRAVTPWSPDGKNLVFVSFNRDIQASEIGVATLNRSDNAVSVKRIGSGTLAFWSPN